MEELPCDLFNQRRRNRVSDLFDLVLFGSAHDKTGGKSLDLFQFTREQAAQEIPPLVFKGDKESRLVVIGTNDGFTWVANVDDFRVDGRLALLKREQCGVDLSGVLLVLGFGLEGQIGVYLGVSGLVILFVCHYTFGWNCGKIKITCFHGNRAVHGKRHNLGEVGGAVLGGRKRVGLFFQVLSYSHIHQTLAELGNAVLYRVADLVEYGVPDLLEFFTDNVKVILAEACFSGQQPVDVFANQILGTNERTHARKFAK